MKLNKPSVAFVIHDFNRLGGQERSTWEIVNRLKGIAKIHVYASSFCEPLPHVTFHKVPVFIRKPLFVKDVAFRLCATLMLAFKRYDVVHATGTCVFKADIFTIQFVQAKWSKEKSKLVYPMSFKFIKDSIQLKLDLIWERIVLHLNSSSKYIAISDQVETDLIEIYRLKNTLTIKHGVNLQEFALSDVESLRSKIGLAKNKKYLLFVGTFERKGLFFLLNAFARICTKYPDWELLIVGNGDVERAQKICKKNNMLARVHFFGMRKDVASFFQVSDLFILPSLYDPFGLVGIEALACGCPSIISKNSGCSELIQIGNNGWILNDPTDSNELGLLLEEVFSSAEKLKGMRSVVRQSVSGEGWESKESAYKSALKLEELTL